MEIGKKIVVGATIVSLVIIGICIGVWCVKDPEFEYVDTFDPSTANTKLGCVTCPPPGASIKGCSGKVKTNPPFRRVNVEKVEWDGYETTWHIGVNKRKDRKRTLEVDVSGTCCWKTYSRDGESDIIKPGPKKESTIAFISK